jgi:hypothetical protein
MLEWSTYAHTHTCCVYTYARSTFSSPGARARTHTHTHTHTPSFAFSFLFPKLSLPSSHGVPPHWLSAPRRGWSSQPLVKSLTSLELTWRGGEGGGRERGLKPSLHTSSSVFTPTQLPLCFPSSFFFLTIFHHGLLKIVNQMKLLICSSREFSVFRIHLQLNHQK